MSEELSKVALVRCDSYERDEVRRALRKAVELLGGLDSVFAGIKPVEMLGKDAELLLKPNLLGKAAPEKVITTHPEVFRAVGELLKEEGYGNLVYGDSPGTPVPGMEKTAEGCGIKQMADELGIRAGDFEHGTEIEYSGGSAAQHFVLCNEIINVTGADGREPSGAVINICKMKTHQLERITGAVKNTFGCVCGLNKAASHAKFESPEYFARMLADLNRLVDPALHIMDGVIAMEGNGPSSGDPVPMNVLLASTDPIALDTVFCRLIDLDPQLVATNTICMDAGIGTWKDEEMEIRISGFEDLPDGAVITGKELTDRYANKDFNVQRSREFRGRINVMKHLGGLISKKPVVLEDKCIGCGVCEDTCPVEGKAVTVQEGSTKKRVAAYDYARCIRCYCCQEMCPEGAITVKKSLLAKIIDRKWKV